MDLFVPGRICLFGEHSDWAGGYRRSNSGIEKGYNIITGTNQGIHARVRPAAGKLIIHSTLSNGTRVDPIEIPMEPGALLEEAEKGGFFSYCAGVAYQVTTHYRVGGLEIDNYRTDLPVRKGLSSSAAVCVLTARAFNRVYDLKLTVRGEMEYAYMGEIVTPSRCGRMDQGCAYGNRPIMMVHDRDVLTIEELSVARDIHLVVVDLCAGKDTKTILSHLNRCYPFPQDERDRRVHECLGPLNRELCAQARGALERGDAQRIGALMTRAQELFDALVAPACPQELTAPRLHQVLAHPAAAPLSWGGKGVGSQGDGCAQFVARGPEEQRELMATLARDLDVVCLPLDIRAARAVRKAVIPAAGFGTRLYPASKAAKKELFPVVDRDGIAKPVIHIVVEEALSAQVDEVHLVVQQDDREMFRSYFCSPVPAAHFHRLPKHLQNYAQRIADMGQRISFVTQDTQDGFGHAVLCARDAVGDEPFLLMLGDHLYRSTANLSCAAQVLALYHRTGRSTVGVRAVQLDEVQRFGIVTGTWRPDGATLDIHEFVEKPTPEYAQEHLATESPNGELHYLSVFGIYVLTPRVFAILREHVDRNIRQQGEFQLTAALDILRQEDGFVGCEVAGERYDTGVPDSYLKALMGMRGNA